MSSIASVFREPKFRKLVQENLPSMFKEARREAETYSNIMNVGSHRKRKIINLLIKHIGNDRIEDVFSSTMAEIDIKIDSIPISIKTISNNNSLKMKWTMDYKIVAEIMTEYTPRYDLILARINWDMNDRYQPSGLFFIPKQTQTNIMQRLGRENYLRPPKEGTNSRGVSLTKQAYEDWLTDTSTLRIAVDWKQY